MKVIQLRPASPICGTFSAWRWKFIPPVASVKLLPRCPPAHHAAVKGTRGRASRRTLQLARRWRLVAPERPRPDGGDFVV